MSSRSKLLGRYSSSSVRFISATLVVTLLALTSCGGGSKTISTPQVDFTLSSTPASITLAPGGAGQKIAVNAVPVNAFSGTVTVTVAGLPAGVTASPSSLTLAARAKDGSSFPAVLPASRHSRTLPFVATSHPSLPHLSLVKASLPHRSLSHPFLAYVQTIAANTAPLPASYTISASPAQLTLAAGEAGAQVSVTANALGGFTAPVQVIVGGLPAGVSAKPATFTLKPGIVQHVIITAAASAFAGKPTFTFTGFSGRRSHKAQVYASITATRTSSGANYTLVASKAALTLTAGAIGSPIGISANPVNNFTGQVNVAIAGLPAHVTAKPASMILAAGVAQSLTLTASSSAAPGNFTITFTGTSGSLTHKTTVSLTVAAAATPDYTLTVSPASLALTAGAAGSHVSVKATSLNGFTGMVKVAIGGLPTGVTANPASLSLAPGTAQNTTLTASSSAPAASSTITFTGTSGSLTHSAPLALTVAAAPTPNYTLTVTPASLALTAGATGSPVSVKATSVNGFTGTVKVALAGLPTGVTASPASLSLTRGTAQSTTLTASSSVAAASSTITFTGTSGSLTHSAPLALTVQSAQTTTTAPDVTTFHYDIARDGLNAQETILTPSNVNSAAFGKIGIETADGKVDAQPLYLANVTIGGQLHNVLYVATEHGSLYAWDADSGKQLWKTSVIQTGETPSDSHNCGQIETEIGITSTPVIDRKQGPHGTIFTVGMSRDANGGYHQRLHAFDIATGAEISGSPTEITATYPGTGDNSHNGDVVFDPSQYAERSALLLAKGNIYTAWTSHCDAGAYTGWIIAYSETTLKQSQVLNLTPNGSQGAIWMAGDGLAADSSGDLYLLDANGTFDTTINGQGFPSSGDYGNAMLRLTTTSGKLAVADYFEPYNTVQESAADTDLGSGGEILLPDQKDAGGIVHHLIVGAGKDGNIYLADRGNLGKYNPSTTAPDSNIYQQVSGQLAGPNFSTPAYFNGVLYYAAIGDSLKAFPLTNARLATSPSSHSAATFRYPGATPAVSANGAQNGIVWAVESHDSAAAVLHAYDPTNLAHEYYNSNQATSGRDSFGNGNKFISPLIVNGKVYIGTQTGVAIFGLLSR